MTELANVTGELEMVCQYPLMPRNQYRGFPNRNFHNDFHSILNAEARLFSRHVN